jgi:hypothetical protein
MVSAKLITLRYGDMTMTTPIHSDMSEAEIYDELCSTLDMNSIDISNSHIVVMDPSHNNEKVYLHYQHLKQGRLYLLGTSDERIQGAGTYSSASQRTKQYLAVVQQHWGLASPTDIFPANIAPHDTPSKWPRRFVEELRKLSVRTKNKHQDAIGLLRAQVEAGENCQGDTATKVTSSNIRNAVKEYVRLVAQQANELIEDWEDTALFAGGLGEAAEQALQEGCDEDGVVGWEYEQDGKFQIGTHFR